MCEHEKEICASCGNYSEVVATGAADDDPDSQAVVYFCKTCYERDEAAFQQKIDEWNTVYPP